MDETFIDYYQLLEVHIFASKEAIKAAYKRLSLKYHPDNGGNKELFLLIQEAYRTLSDQKWRSQYLKIWKKNKLSHNDYCKELSITSDEDMIFQPLMETVNAYMFYIMNKEYEKAYMLLCHETIQRIFKKDYIKWQELVGEIHEIIYFESSFSDIQNDPTFGTCVLFTVKVREYNMLLNRVEEDYFQRKLISEDGVWKIQLNDINIRQIIKKYKKIVYIHQKRSKSKPKSIKNYYVTKFLDFDSFIHNVEYEYLRYKRYNRCFGVLAIITKKKQTKDMKVILRTVRLNTRITDSFTQINEDTIIVLMPETNQAGINTVKKKIELALYDLDIKAFESKGLLMNSNIKSAKELFNLITQ